MNIDLSLFIPFLVVGAVLGALGKGIQSLVFKGCPKHATSGWRRLFYRTMWLHPMAAGAVLGLTGWVPVPEFMGTGLASGAFWYALAGAQAHTVVRLVDSEIKSRIKN